MSRDSSGVGDQLGQVAVYPESHLAQSGMVTGHQSSSEVAYFEGILVVL